MPHRGDIESCTSSLDTTITSTDVINENFASSSGGFRVVLGTTKSNAGGELNISSSGGAPYTDTTFTMVAGKVYTLSTKFASRSNMGATVLCEVIVSGGTIASTTFTALGTTYSFNFTGTINGTATLKYTYVLPLFPPPIAPYAFSIDNVHLYYNDTTHSTVYTCGLDSAYSYKYGFNGQEKDDEINEVGTSYSFDFRILDTRLGRFLSADPLFKSYPWNSTYAFAENRIIDGKDLEGKEWSRTITYDIKTGQFNVDYQVKLKVLSSSECVTSVEEKTQIMTGIQKQFEIVYSSFDKDKQINYSGSLEYVFVANDGSITPATTTDFALELIDAYNFINGAGEYGITRDIGKTQINYIKVAVSDKIDNESAERPVNEIAKTASHELGHSAGLLHPWDITDADGQNDINQNNSTVAPATVVNNVMNTRGNPDPALQSKPGDCITPDQSTKVNKTVTNDVKKKPGG